MSLLDPEAAYEDTTLPDHIGETYRGHKGVSRATTRWIEPYETFSIELERIVGVGDRLEPFREPEEALEAAALSE